MQFWLVGFGLSLAILASENFRHFYSGKKPQSGTKKARKTAVAVARWLDSTERARRPNYKD